MTSKETASTADERRRPALVLSREELLAAGIVLLAVAVALLHAGKMLFYTEDDSYIGARYARNLARGFGLVFNKGEREWGCTSTLRPLIEAALYRFGIDPVVAAKVHGVAAFAICCPLVYRIAARVVRPALAAFAPLLVATFGPLVLWSSAGLETGLFAGLLLGSVAAAMSERSGSERAFSWSLVLLLLAALDRYDGPLYLPVLLLARWDGRWRRELVWLASFGICFIALWLCHVGYYHALLPNSLVTKVLGLNGRLLFGVTYLTDFLREYPWLVGASLAAVIVVAIRPGPHRRVSWPLAIGVLLSLGYPVWTGGDWMPNHRFFAPLVLFAAPLVTIAAGLLAAWLPAGRRVGEAVGACAIVLLAHRCFLNDENWMPRLHTLRTANDTFLQVGELTAGGDPSLTYALGDIGGFGWPGDVRILDLAGLTDHRIAEATRKSSVEASLQVERERRPEVILVKTFVTGNRPALDAADRAMVALGSRQLTSEETSLLLSAAHGKADVDGAAYAREEGHYRVVNVAKFLGMDQYFVILAREDAIPRLSTRLRTVCLNSGYAVYRYGSPDRGLALMTEELDANPYEVTGLLDQSTRLLYANQPEAAERLLRRRLDFDPFDMSAMNNLGFALAVMNRFDEAIAILQRVVDMYPGDSQARNILNRAEYERLHHWDNVTPDTQLR